MMGNIQFDLGESVEDGARKKALTRMVLQEMVRLRRILRPLRLPVDENVTRQVFEQ